MLREELEVAVAIRLPLGDQVGDIGVIKRKDDASVVGSSVPATRNDLLLVGEVSVTEPAELSSLSREPPGELVVFGVAYSPAVVLAFDGNVRANNAGRCYYG